MNIFVQILFQTWLTFLFIYLLLELYNLATKTTKSLENVHPGGKILEGPELRLKVTELVNSGKDLYEEVCSILRDKGSNLVRLLFKKKKFILFFPSF